MDFRADRGFPKGLRFNGSNSKNIKLQRFDRKSKTLQAKSDQLQRENMEMEQRIIALRQMMQKEREEREKLGGSRWKSSKLSQEKQQAALKSERKSSKMKGQPKFKILSDKPLGTYTNKPVDINRPPDSSALCGQCENVKAKLECVECGEIYCPPCFKQFHAKGAMRRHGWQPIDQERPCSSHNRSSNISSSGRQRTPALESRESLLREAQPVDICVEREQIEREAGGRLLEGSYDEQESAASFQEALRDWRNQSPSLPSEKSGQWVNPVADLTTGSKSNETEDSVGVQATGEAVADIKLTFNSSLSYADRLMLKKHRKNPESTMSYGRPRNKESAKSPVASKASKSKSGPVSPRISNSPPKSVKQNGKRQNGSSCQKKSLTSSENSYPNVLQIQLLPSDEDDSKYGSSDSSSPIVNYTIDEGPTARTDRRTLSQMGRLAIVELSFSDPENDVGKSKDSSCSPALTNQSSLSLKRAPSGHKSPLNDTGTAHFPHPPNAPSNTYVARQKILLEKKKKGSNGQVSSATNSKNKSKRVERKWQPSNKYVGLSSFFMAGVEKESIDGVSPNDERSLSHVNMETSHPVVGIQLADSWRQDSSLSQIGGISNGDTILNSDTARDSVRREGDRGKNGKNFDRGNRDEKGPASTEVSVCKNQNAPTPKIVTTKSTLASPNNADTPRVSMTDFDFLSAMPPASKGDDLLKLHRASTVTLFALSPQPPDIWNDDSEVEIPSAFQTSKVGEELDAVPSGPNNGSTLSESDRKEIDKEDALALEALSKEIKDNRMKSVNKLHSRGTDWEDDSLSIEDNDDGSGLTSSADGEESDDPDSKDFDRM